MKGMMFWDYEGDDTMGTLRKALWNAVMKKISNLTHILRRLFRKLG